MARNQAFGKFYPGEKRSLRRFEIVFEIKAREGYESWQSKIDSVQKLLDHLQRFTRSESLRSRYLRHLLKFCDWCNLMPDDLVRLTPRQASALVQKFTDELARANASRIYVNSVIKRLKTFSG
jgi:hypothetical protein